MKIASIELDNIKSYRRQTIYLTDGVNAIAGHNGSGKTTILEAIGFALFDYLPYPQSAFLREGEKTGTVRVRLQLNDGREYEVVRKVGSGAMYHVTDVESGVRLADGNKSVQEWLRESAFDLEGEADLEALFKNAVGVPQGLMTSDFVGTSRTRKAIFDPLLRVEEYEKAWSELLQTSNNIRDRIGVLQQEIARLGTDVERIPELSDQHDELTARAEESRAQVDALTAQAAEIAARRSVLDGLRDGLAALEVQLGERRGKVEARSGEVEVARARVGMAEEARDIVQRTQEGHQRFEEARRALTALDTERRQRDKLQQQADLAVNDMKNTESAIAERNRERAEAIADGQAVVALQPEVDRQEALEHDLGEARMQLRDVQRLREEGARLDRQITELEGRIVAGERLIASARAAQVEAVRLDSVTARHRDVMAYLATLAPVREQMEAVAVEGKRLREQFDGLSADVERLQALRAEVGQLEPRASGRRGLEVRERELREERIRIQATLDYQEVARADLQRSACPLLELQCPVVQADVATLERFDLRVADLASRIGALDVELTVLTPQLTAAVAASERVQTLSVAIAKLESSERMLPEVGASLDICRTQYAELNSRVAGSAALETEKVSLEREMSRLQNIAAEAARLGVLEDGQKRDQEGLEARRADRRRVDEGLKSRASAEVDVRRLETELQRMGDPRGRQRGLQAKASRLGAIEDRLQQLQTHLQDFADKFRATVGELHRYEGLDGRIAEQKAIEERFQQDYELFIANRGDAAELDARRADLQHAEQELVAAQQAVIETQADRDAIRDQYDPEEHRSVESVHTEIMQRLASAQSDCKRWSDELRQIDEALQRARLQEQRMARKVEERAELEAAGTAVRFIRQTIKDAGPAVTETLLQNISAVANDIYAEIMDDFAPELRWDRDYEVLVQRGPDARKFAQLSGGEQMSAALAVRLALLKEMSGVDMAFFDEPTQNMDSERRVNLASQIRQIRGFHQLIVISHDDTFEHHTDNLIRLRKEEDETVVEV